MLIRHHHYLRDKYRWYHLWHTHPHHSKIHWGLLIIYCLTIVLTVDIILFTPNIVKLPKSADQSKSITTQSDWQAGSYDSEVDLTTTSGTMKLREEYKVDLSPYSYTSAGVTGNIPDVWDNNISSQVTFAQIANLTINFDNTIDITKIREYISEEIEISSPLQGGSIGNCPASSCWQEKIYSPAVTTSTIIASHLDFMAIDFGILYELEVYSKPTTATHTSAAGQIGVTGESGRYVADFLNFTTSENEMDNSDIRYRFRKTNADGSWTGDWTDYIDHTGSAINLQNYSQLTISTDDVSNGRTYLQVETKFTRTDVAAAPTISDYSISYHTNKKPNKPTGQ